MDRRQKQLGSIRKIKILLQIPSRETIIVDKKQIKRIVQEENCINIREKYPKLKTKTETERRFLIY